MAQPDYVPLVPADRVRPAERLPPAERWVTDRPGEIPGLRQPDGAGFGNHGPDQGYALKLAKRFTDRLKLAEHEEVADVLAGATAVALKRASLFGRAPVIYDFEHVYTLFGLLGDAPKDLIDFRRELFAESAHHYWTQREIADLVPEATLRMPPAMVRERLKEWRGLLSHAADVAGAD